MAVETIMFIPDTYDMVLKTMFLVSPFLIMMLESFILLNKGIGRLFLLSVSCVLAVIPMITFLCWYFNPVKMTGYMLEFEKSYFKVSLIGFICVIIVIFLCKLRDKKEDRKFVERNYW